MHAAHDAVTKRLARAGCVAAEGEAEELLADEPDPDTLERRIVRREAGEPLAWITGWTTFCDLRIRVTSGVYVPRPQTEVLARRAIDILPDAGRALDLCAGSGAIATAMLVARPAASVIASDISPAAAACARSNGVPSFVGDLAAPIRGARTFDVVTAVAPYVPNDRIAYLPSDVQDFEPRLALDGGDDGIAVITRLIDAAALLLRPTGHLLLEIGGDQNRPLGPLLGALFTEVEWWHDEDGDLRGVHASAPKRPT